MLPNHETFRRLRPELTGQPQQMISEFCDQFDLADSRAMRWRMTLAFFGAEACDGREQCENVTMWKCEKCLPAVALAKAGLPDVFLR